MPDVLVRRFEQYFGHPDNDHDVLNVGDRAVACSRLRQALEMLGGLALRKTGNSGHV
jgi:hypothetical protein